MKKALVLLVVAALTLFSSVALAGEIAVSGSIDTRSWNVDNRDMTDLLDDRQAKTETRVRLNIDGKVSDTTKARISIENDWDNWARFEQKMANGASMVGNTGWLDLREAWVQVGLPLGLNLKGGHQLLQLGNGWFFRSMKYGSDAWVLFKDIDNLHLGFVDVKIAEGAVDATDDADAYVLVATYKISDDMKIGMDIADVKFRQVGGVNPDEMMNISAHFNGKLGPVELKAQADMQMGDDGNTPKSKYKGTELVAQVSMPLGPVSARALLGQGSGPDYAVGAVDTKEYVNYLDADPHYGAIYEYLVGQPAGFGVGAHEGFSNTFAIGVGATYKATDSLSISADVLKLAATEAPAAADDDLGMEIAVRIGWQIEKGVNWNWTIAQFAPGDAYGPNPDNVEAIYGVLGVSF